MGSGLAYCIKMLVENVGETFGVSRTFFEGGNGMTEGGDFAIKTSGDLGQGGGTALGSQPADQRAYLRLLPAFAMSAPILPKRGNYAIYQA